VSAALERALASESDADAAAAMIAASLRVARADAGALLSRVAGTAVVRANEALGRQVADYRASLAAGETDPTEIQRTHDAREDERLRAAGE
jgi:hypothetical protein